MAINNLGTAASFATRNNPTFTGTVNWNSAVLNAATATVATAQNTTSGTFTDLATVGPSVTVTTGTKVLITLFSYAGNSLGVSNRGAFGFEVSGATTLAASTTSAFYLNQSTAGYGIQAGFSFILTGLTAGSNTFKMKYRASGGGTATFENRVISVVDMGS